MSKRLLVTTALHETWDFERPILFLSESCKIFHERKKWVSLDYTTMDHRWDNREKFYLDYENLNLVYEKVLLSVSSKLNGIHGTSYNSEYWRIIIGPWLFFFTHVVFERWCQIKRAEESDNVLETIILESMHETFVPKDMTDFAQLVNTDSWNHFIYSHILQHFSKIPVRKQGINKRVISSIPQVGRGSKVNKVINWIFDKYNRKKRVILVDLSLQKKHLLRLFFKYGYLINVPINDNIQEISINNKLRDWELKIKDVNDFEKCLISLLPLQIPTTYLEGYTSIFEVAQLLE
jgi:putative transferase (TIGR04331 family)